MWRCLKVCEPFWDFLDFRMKARVDKGSHVKQIRHKYCALLYHFFLIRQHKQMFYLLRQKKKKNGLKFGYLNVHPDKKLFFKRCVNVYVDLCHLL